jgi:hypothetical protein
MQYTQRPELKAFYQTYLDVLRSSGATLIDVAFTPDYTKIGDDRTSVLLYEFKSDLNKYLAGRAGKYRTLEDLIKFNDENKEREVIRETLRVYKDVCGKPAKGWLSSSLRCTLNTVDILAEEGLIFTTDLLNDDQPYLVKTRSGKPMVSVSYTSEVDDFSFLRQGLSAETGLMMFKEQFDWLYAESAVSGRFMNVGLHPHVIGVPHRANLLRKFLAYAKQFDGVWFATREEVANSYLGQHETHIPAGAKT